ncbi:hypothetical protein OCS_02899 [Ophiocordyceps sinensis CO18]|uniref:Uncharacterized protein n=1 Tax=Ophiocordyceps sinensis (strain Co18 / CGMCC 3.14243) TaxID=911162 RepID=T5AG37_OPHSC|nr:hypothetical protein OCS_02899 [Ophiocordyceps sinensis CO18]
MTRSKRAKRIIRCLSAAQYEDHVLSCSATPLIRYNLLHNYHRCVQVSVELGSSSDRYPLSFSFDAMPKFLQSQLEAQKIADGSRLWSQVVPLLTFVQAHLRRFDKSRGFPTLFVWHSRENHRSYFLFAFVEIKMASKIYTARELLRLRKISAGQELYDRLFEKLRGDNGLGVFLANLLAASGRRKSLTVQTGEVFRMPSGGALPLIREEDAEVSIPPDTAPVKAPVKSVAARQLDGTDSEWKYRGRTDSEDDVVQPICSPAGLAAQRDEGFQRFYKAVVSPTHVRVTAGGRIVPNTRGPSSPTAKWSKEKAAGDCAYLGRGVGRDQSAHSPFPIPQPPFGAFSPMFPGFVPGMAAAQSPFQMMPWHMGVNMSGAFGMVHPHVTAMAGSVSGSTNSVASLKSDKFDESANSENANSVRVSPPEQFDHSRPFYYNGQWMMPPGSAMFPVGMPPIAGFPLPMGGQMMHPRYGMHPMMHLHAMKSDPSLYPHSAVSSSASPYAGSSNPPVSSIRQSEITKRQLENLRGHLRFLEDQLQYNKHQIDEKLVEQQIQVLLHQIQLFGKNLEAQLGFEEGGLSKAEKDEESNDSTSSCDGLRIKSSATSDARLRHNAQNVSNWQDNTSQAPAMEMQRSKDCVTSQLQGGPNPSKSLPLKSALKKPRPSEPMKKSSSIPVSAALAPPFRPRVDGATSTPGTTESSLRSATSLAGTEPSYRSAATKNDAGKPYLVGTLPGGFSPSTAAGIDYMYNRDLTEDELRARHMYWGNAPRNLQKGYPKFDGKDFYPPSPIKGGSSESEATSSPSAQRRRIPSGNVQMDYGLAMAESDPFASLDLRSQRPPRNNLTQSEDLPRLESPMTPPPAAAKQSPRKSTSQTGRTYEDFRQALNDNGRPLGGRNDKSSSESGDDSNITFKGRRNATPKYGSQHASSRLARSTDVCRSKNSNEIWQSMLRRGKSSGAAVPGTVSSMTAQGVLPNYAGHATASLTPAFANTTISPKASYKPGDSGDAGPTGQEEDKKVENRPPVGANVKGSLRRAGYVEG